MDDIVIPTPRTAQSWFCANCGEDGAEPEANYLLMDPRYAVGTHGCTKAKVALIADFHFDHDRWQKEHDAMIEREVAVKAAAEARKRRTQPW